MQVEGANAGVQQVEPLEEKDPSTEGEFTKLQTIHYLKGTGTRDLIWLKVVSLDRSWLVGLTDDL